MSTKLVLNLSMLGGNPTGLGVYSAHCADALIKRFDLGLIAGQVERPGVPVLAQAPASVALGAGRLAAVRRQFWMRQLKFGAGHLVYSPTHHGLPSVTGQVITIHDLIALHFPAQHRMQYYFFKYAAPRLLKKCRAVFTVSEATRADIAETYRFPAERIFVVPNGVDRSVFGGARESSASEPAEPFLLMVGARYAHKNVDEVLAMSHLWSGDFRLVVTSCGGKYRALLEQQVLARGLGDRVHFTDYLSRDALLNLYRRCSALLYPSRWEGFGIPPLEAMACGRPVIASDIPVHREVLGDAAFFVKLGDESSWGAAFADLASADKRADKLARYEDLLNRFTWANSAQILEKALLTVEPRLASIGS